MTAEVGRQPSSGSGADPAAWGEMLAEAYRAIGQRTMRDLPIFNDALAVEAVGFRNFKGVIMGIMVTPWFMNVVMPADEIAGESQGPTVRVRFPVGDIDLTLSEVAPVGRIASCSLFSPMSEFADTASARAAAEAALVALMQPPDSAEAAKPAVSAIDRRNFLRGVLTERRG